MLDLSQFRKNRENRTKVLNLYKLEAAFKDIPISADEHDKLLQAQHIKSIIDRHKY